MELARSATSPREPMQGLRAIVALRRELVELEERYVDDALRQGRTWSQIAGALGVSKQAAHKRHSGRARTTPAGKQADPRRRLLVTGQARRVVQRARVEARAAGGAEVGPEHLLLGLLGDDHGTALRALESAGVELEAARAAIPRPPGRPSGSGRVPVSEQARAALEQSLREAMRLGDSHLGVEHLLLALLRDPEEPAARLLAQLGVPADRVSDRVHQLVDVSG
jgi:ATP-dependent Clp protease ATP-binding subunit ClpA